MLEIASLNKVFHRGLFRTSRIRAVHDVSLSVRRGETLGLVGESGCGKTTLARLVLRLIPPDSGRIVLGDHNITRLSGKTLNRARRKMQIIFQHPFSSFDPLYRLKKSFLEPLRIHGLLNTGSEVRVAELIRRVGLSGDILTRYPHEVSGGELQRVALARALVLGPELLVLDEPTSMLDVSMQAKILCLLKEIQSEYGMAFLFISHDLDVVRFMSDRIAVMNKGRIVEQGNRDRILNAPEEVYTKMLLKNHTEFQKERE